MPVLTLVVLPDRFCIGKLPARADLPDWATGALVSWTRAREETSLVCSQDCVPQGWNCERDWCAFQVKGPLDLACTGILASIAAPLAAADIPIFAISTYDTDYVLVRAAQQAAAMEALTAAGHLCVPVTPRD